MQMATEYDNWTEEALHDILKEIEFEKEFCGPVRLKHIQRLKWVTLLNELESLQIIPNQPNAKALLITRGQFSEKYSSAYAMTANRRDALENTRLTINAIINHEVVTFALLAKNIVRQRIFGYDHYIKFREESENHETLACSHHFAGFSLKPFGVHYQMSIHFNTNFGYGAASYFYLVLRYKDVPIYRCEEWVAFPYAQVSLIRPYTFTYEKEYVSWIKAIEDASLAANKLADDPKSFVQDYIVSDLDAAFERIESILLPNAYASVKMTKAFSNWRPSTQNTLAFDKNCWFVTRVIIMSKIFDRIDAYKLLFSLEKYDKRLKDLNDSASSIIDVDLPLLDTIITIWTCNFEKQSSLIVRIEQLQLFRLQGRPSRILSEKVSNLLRKLKTKKDRLQVELANYRFCVTNLKYFQEFNAKNI